MGRGPEPQRLGTALAELIARRGYSQVRGDSQLQSAWADAAGAVVARQTRAVAIRRGVLHIGVDHAPLLAELAGYYRQVLLEKLQGKHADLRIRDLKFKLDSGVAARNPSRRSPDG
jgi:predicted nucleic acid-binding Zn ribbon protein